MCSHASARIVDNIGVSQHESPYVIWKPHPFQSKLSQTRQHVMLVKLVLTQHQLGPWWIIIFHETSQIPEENQACLEGFPKHPKLLQLLGFSCLMSLSKSLLSGGLPVKKKTCPCHHPPPKSTKKNSPSKKPLEILPTEKKSHQLSHMADHPGICLLTPKNRIGPSCRGNRRWPPSTIADQDPYLTPPEGWGTNTCRWL